jgi:hypothetical protein
MYSLKLITGPDPMVEPVTASEIKQFAHIPHSVEDTLIEGWIKTARIEAENYQRRAYISQVFEMSFDEFPAMPISLDRPPLLQLMQISYWDYLDQEYILYFDGTNPVLTTEEAGTEPETNSDFIIDTDREPGRVGFAFGKCWPGVTLRPLNSVKFRYAAGYGLTADSIPQTVKDAIMVFCTHMNENRAGETEFPRAFYDLLEKDRFI